MQTIKKIIPGFLVCVGIALISELITKFYPTIGSATLAIILGIILGNTLFTHKRYNPGTKYSEGELLAYSIVLMGASIKLGDIKALGSNGLFFIILQMTLTILITYFLGKVFRFNKKFTLLMAAGNAVCGSSAVAAVAPVVNAKDKDKAISITMVNLTGTVLMFILPAITLSLYSNETLYTSAFIGGILQSVGQVVASAKMINEDVVKIAAIFKIIRVILIVAIVFVFSKINTNDGEHPKHKHEDPNKIKLSVPWFIIGFFIVSFIGSIDLIPTSVAAIFKEFSTAFEIIALAAIGMRVKIRDLIKEGPKAIMFSGCIGVAQMIFAYVLIKILL